jgi:hypothetical protein
MKDKTTLLKQKQILCINDAVTEWVPAKDGEMMLGQTLLGVAYDHTQAGRIVRNESQIASVREVTEQEVEKFFALRDLHDHMMADYYNKNSYTGD